MTEENDLINEMIVVVAKILDELDQLVLSTQNQPNNLRLINEITEKFKTIQNTVSFYEFSKLELLSEHAVNLLNNLSSQEVGLTIEHITCLISTIDAIRDMQKDIKKNGKEPIFCYQDILNKSIKFKNDISNLPKIQNMKD